MRKQKRDPDVDYFAPSYLPPPRRDFLELHQAAEGPRAMQFNKAVQLLFLICAIYKEIDITFAGEEFWPACLLEARSFDKDLSTTDIGDLLDCAVALRQDAKESGLAGSYLDNARSSAIYALYQAWLGDLEKCPDALETANFMLGATRGIQEVEAEPESSIKQTIEILDRMRRGASKGGLRSGEMRRMLSKLPNPETLREERDLLIASGMSPRDVSARLALRYGKTADHIRKLLKRD